VEQPASLIAPSINSPHDKSADKRQSPSVEEATEDASRRAVEFAVARTSLSREEAYMLLSIIGELRIGTSPRPVMATRLIVPEEPLRAAGWTGELP
jgi:acetamidase/formamidase